jgi:hypothetical protein
MWASKVLDADDIGGPEPAVPDPIPPNFPFFLGQDCPSPKSTITSLPSRLSQGSPPFPPIVLSYIFMKRREARKE